MKYPGKKKSARTGMRVSLPLLILVLAIVTSVLIIYSTPVLTSEKRTSGNLTFTDAAGDQISGTIEISMIGAPPGRKDNVNSITWNNAPNAWIYFDAHETKSVSMNLRISEDSPSGVVSLDDFGAALPGSVAMPAPGTPVKYVELHSSGVAFTDADISIYYSKHEIGELDEKSLVIYSYDGGAWNELSSKADSSDNAVSTTVNSLTIFAISTRTEREELKKSKESEIPLEIKGTLEADEFKTKGVAVKLKIIKRGNGQIKIEDHGKKNPVSVAPPGNSVKFIDISAADNSFESAEVRIQYTDEELGGVDENTLVVYHWNGGAWDALPTVVDVVNNLLTATTSSLSPFAVSGEGAVSGIVDKILLTTNRFVIIDDPRTTGANNGTGFIVPSRQWTDNYHGNRTTITIWALALDYNGLPVPYTTVNFTLMNPGGAIDNTTNRTTNGNGLANLSINLDNRNYYGKWQVNANTSGITRSYQFIYNWWGCVGGAGCSGHSGNSISFTEAPASASSPYLGGSDDDPGRFSSSSHTQQCTYCHLSYNGLGFTPSMNTPDVHSSLSCDNANCHAAVASHSSGTEDMVIGSCHNCHTSSNTTMKAIINGTGVANYSTTSTYHNANATIPCIICHGPMHNITKPDPSAGKLGSTEDSHCTICHTSYNKHNSSNATSGGVNCTFCHSKDIHYIKVFAQNSTGGAIYINATNVSRGNCTLCHQNGNTFFNSLKSNSWAGSYTGRNPPQIQTQINHSNNPLSGKLWNQTPGYWTNTSQITWCRYCHGETNHKSSALGRPSLFKGNNVVNSTITSSTTWCSSCHWQGYTSGSNNYNTMVSTFLEDGRQVPPEISSNSTYGKQSMGGYYDHSGYDKDDSCKNCHGSLSSSTDITGFMHNVATGVGGGNANCISCHNVGGSAGSGKLVNFTAMNDTNALHKNLNSGSASSNATAVYANNKKCWACHGNGSEPSGGHPSNYKMPFTCISCHVPFSGQNMNFTPSSILNVTQHYWNGTSIGTANVSTCYACHNRSEMMLDNFDPDGAGTVYSGANGGNGSSSHYGKKRTDMAAWNSSINNTYCNYCHNNASTVFPFIDNTNKSIANHSASYPGTNPLCSICHSTGRIHNSTLIKPALALPNSTYCTSTCHGPGGSATFNNRAKHNNSVNCTSCHLNSSSSIHPVRYLQNINNTWSTSKTSAVNCTNCHQNSTFWSGAPIIPNPVKHSSNTGNGSLWNSTSTPFWTGQDSSCYYCHNNTKHNATGMGKISSLQANTNNTRNGSLTTTQWCADCHYNTSNPNYKGNLSQWSLTPPLITIDNTGKSSWVNHNGYFGSVYNDSTCKNCHALNGSTFLNTSKNYSHSLDTGTGGGADCISCHNTGGSAGSGRLVNFTAMNDTNALHKNLNSNATTVLSAQNKKCWACHGSGSQPGSNHPSNYKTPYTCTSCHVPVAGQNFNYNPNSTLLNVSQHYWNGTSIGTAAATTCYVCHNKSEMMLGNFDPDGAGTGVYSGTNGGNGSSSHYGKKRTDMSAWNISMNNTYCNYCHNNASTVFPFIDNTNKSIANHSVNYPGTNPLCSGCHLTGRIHNSTLTKPALALPNSTYCTSTCHGPGGSAALNGRAPHNGTVACTKCHLNSSRSIHPIRYLQNINNTWSTSTTSAVNCNNCHQNTTFWSGAPIIPSQSKHSSEPSNGSLWGTYWAGISGSNTSSNNTNVSQEAITTGTTSGIANAQSEDGSFETLTEGNTTLSAVDAYTSVLNNTIASGTIANFANMQSASDGGAYANLTENSTGGNIEDISYYATTGDTNLQNAPDATFSSTQGTFTLTGTGFSSGGSGNITKVILKYYYSITDYGDDTAAIGYTLNSVPTTVRTINANVPYPYPNPTNSTNITSAKGTWTWADVESLGLWTQVTKSSVKDTWANVDAYEVAVTRIVPITYNLNITTDTISVPAAENQYLEINYSKTAADNYSVFVYDGSTWNNRGTLNSTTWTTFNYTLTSTEYNSGNPRVRYMDDQNTAGTTQGSLYIDYQRIHSVTIQRNISRLEVYQNVTGIPDEDKFYLTVKGKTDGDSSESYYAQVYDSVSGWVTKSTINSANSSWYNSTLGSNQISNGTVRIRYIDTNTSIDSVQNTLSIDYSGIRSETGTTLSSCYYCHDNTKHNSTAMGTVSVLFTDPNNTRNGALTTTTFCAGCHYNNAENSYYVGSQWYPAPPLITVNNTEQTSSGLINWKNHTNLITGYTDNDCKFCHALNGTYTATSRNYSHSLDTGIYGGVNCTDCHDLGGMAAKTVDVSSMNKTSAIHYSLNNDTDPTANGARWENRLCWACHGEDDNSDNIANYSEQPNKIHSPNYTRPPSCYDCHRYPLVENGTLGKFEAPIRFGHTAYGEINVSSNIYCSDCHMLEEMVTNFTDPEGTSNSTSAHYGIKRLDLRALEGTPSYCGYCHQNESTVFPFANVANKARSNHSYLPTTPSCGNSTCHGPYDLHNKNLREPVYSDTDCKICHVSEDTHHTTVECMDCHMNDSQINIHPIKYLQEDGYTFSTSNMSGVTCHTCHEQNIADSTLDRLGTPLPDKVENRHSTDVNNGSIWGDYWNHTPHSVAWTTNYTINSRGNVSGFDNLKHPNTSYSTITEAGNLSFFEEVFPSNQNFTTITNWTNSILGSASVGHDTAYGTPTTDGSIYTQVTGRYTSGSGRWNSSFDFNPGNIASSIISFNVRTTSFRNPLGTNNYVFNIIRPNGSIANIYTSPEITTIDSTWKRINYTITDPGNVFTASGTYKLQINTTLSTGNNKRADLKVYFDNVKLSITPVDYKQFNISFTIDNVAPINITTGYYKIALGYQVNIEPVNLYVYDGTNWNFRTTLAERAMTMYYTGLTQNEYNNSYVRVRIIDSQEDVDTTTDNMKISMLYVFSDTNKLYSCEYCHFYNKHFSNALGVPQYYNGSNSGNQSITTSDGTWCASCHYQGYSSDNKTYNDMIFELQSRNLNIPPEITGNATYAPTSVSNYTNHSLSNYYDSTCFSCHGGSLDITGGMSPFTHNLSVGISAGKNCMTCHNLATGLTNGATAGINFTALNQSAHGKMNNANATNQGLDPVVGACWACHQSDGDLTTEQHPDRQKTPKTCTECHLGTGTYNASAYNAIIVSEHYYGGTDITAGNSGSNISSCINCHENVSEMILYNNDTDTATRFTGDGIRLVGGNMSFYHYGNNRTDIRQGTSVNCSYCHQNTSTAFSIAMVNSAYNSSIQNHSQNYISSPLCTNSTCHNSGRMHNSTLTKPVLTLPNSTYCTNSCHGPGGSALKNNKARHNNTLNCTQCHLTSSSSIHPVRYLQNINNSWNTAYTNAVNCTNCHQNSTFWSGAPIIPAQLKHSSNLSNGSMWNISSTPYWTKQDEACYYCHNNTKHNSSALGQPAAWKGTNIVNSSTTMASTWCAGCHWQGYSSGSNNYNNMVTKFTAIGLSVPPEITGNVTYAPTGKPGYTNHSDFDKSDSSCKSCHGSLVTGANVTELMHNVATGITGGPDCISCHDKTGSGSNLKINNSIMNSSSSVHRNLNNNSVNSSGISAQNKKCWGCHQSNGSEPPGTIMGDRASDPYDCFECHSSNKPYVNVSSAPDVSEHIPSAGQVFTAATCANCHNNSVDLTTANITDVRVISMDESVSHYGTKTELIDTTGNTNSLQGCIYCHYDPGNSVKWGNASDPRNSTLRTHSETSNTDCFSCHVEGGIVVGETLENFHDPSLYTIANYAQISVPSRNASASMIFSRKVILDDPNNGSGDAPTLYPWNNTDYWNGEATTVRAYSLIMNGSGLAASGANVTFILRYPNNSIVNEYNILTGSDGIASYVYDINSRNYYGNWTIDVSAVVDGGYANTSSSFVYNWWGCANCHNESKGSPGTFGTVTSRSPYLEGYDPVHTGEISHLNRVNASDCIYCHRSYGNGSAGSQYPADVHYNKKKCQDCHSGANGTNGTPAMPSCTECHNSTANSNLSWNSTLNGIISRYSGDPATPMKNHDPDGEIPCVICHDAMHKITTPYPQGQGNTITEPQNCAVCHINKSHSQNDPVDCTKCHSQDAHAIKFITNLTTASTVNYSINRSLAAACENCHNSTGLNSYFNNNGFSPKVNDSYNYNLTRHNNMVSCNTCHDRLHWTGYMNSSGSYSPSKTGAVVCTDCHSGTNNDVKNTTAAWGYIIPVKSKHNGTVPCESCHASSKHGIRYLQQDMVSFGNKTGPVNCVNCHQQGYTGAPQIPVPINHSTDPDAGGKWNSNPGYWTNGTNNTAQLSACNYCHSDTKHDSTALGYVSSLMNSNNVRNGSLTTSRWCADCHDNTSNPNYKGNLSQWSPTPPLITINNTGNSAWVNHSTYLDSAYNDSNCKPCHALMGSYLSTSLNYSHSLGEGVSGGRDCISCHYIGSFKQIDVTAISSSVHSTINNLNATNAGVAAINGACWACHDSDGNVTSGHPDRYTQPRTCTECHLGTGTYNISAYNATIVSEHFYGGSDITAGNSSSNISSCINCHENVSEMILYNNDTDYATSFTGDGIRLVGGNMSFYHYGANRSDLRTWNASAAANCSYCHQNASTAFSLMMVNSSYNRSISNHSTGYNSTNPSCISTQCHGSGWIHNSSLSKPNLSIPNSSYCLSCHGNNGSGITNYTGSVTGIKDKHNNSLDCSQCHLNTTKSIHPVRYLKQDGSNWSTSNSSAVNCTNCHQGTGLTNFSTAPKIPSPMYHSNNASNGTIWGSYWTSNNSLTACIYCHSDTKHNATALGRPNDWKGNNTVNSSLNVSTWCSSCHYKNYSNYSNMTQAFTSAGLQVPPEITNGTYASSIYNRSNYYNHSLTGYNDSTCRLCHGVNLSSSITTGEFIHNMTGATGATCTDCHYSFNVMNNTTKPEMYVDQGMYNTSLHRSLTCSNCHTQGHRNIGARKACEDCHVVQADPINDKDRHNITSTPSTYFYNSVNVVNITTCTTCHKGTLYNTSIATYGYWKQKDCDYCHTYPDKYYE